MLVVAIHIFEVSQINGEQNGHSDDEEGIMFTESGFLGTAMSLMIAKRVNTNHKIAKTEKKFRYFAMVRNFFFS